MVKVICDGRYEVSDDGRIFTNVKYRERKELIGKVGDCGYRMVVLTVDGKKLYKNVHRLVAEQFVPNPENKPQVNHIDGNKLNNSASNLEWTTNRENQLHARDVITYKNAKLSMPIAEEIRFRYETEHISQRQLAKEYGVGKTIIGQILRNQRWAS